jgi:pimeloyl-ACP methyl ester carboxylesterase
MAILSRRRFSLLLPTVLAWSQAFSRGNEPTKLDQRNLLTFLDDRGQIQPVKTIEQWRRRRQQILAAMQEVMGEMPDPKRKVPLTTEVVEEVKTERFTRQKITFSVESDDRLAAYLFLPTGASTKRLAAVLCLHPTERKLGKGVPAGLGGKPDRHYAVHLVERGYVTLAPDYVGSGDSTFDPYQHGYASATMKGIWNHRRCVDLLQTLPQVDPQRIGVLGHSLGGHNSLFVAVFDERIKCIVSNCGFNSFAHYMRGDLTGWSHEGYMPRIRSKYDCNPDKMPFDFTEVVAALAPRPLLASAPLRDHNFAVEGVKVCIAAAQPVYDLLDAADKLQVNYPDCDHNFPEEARKVAYEFLDRHLA